MTQTLDNNRQAMFFLPAGSRQVDGKAAVSPETMREIAAAVDEHHLLLFTRRLIDGSRKRRLEARHHEDNRARLELARLCIERMLEDDLFAAWGESTEH